MTVYWRGFRGPPPQKIHQCYYLDFILQIKDIFFIIKNYSKPLPLPPPRK